ncbi:MAG: HlyC/CorC family transporter [Nitrospiraceae bacterium]|nr:MAG: HlyC/CorC family transporter [Nitrospiraceae bacterium]
MWLELIAIGVLILLNGFFACAELAIVKTRRSRIKQLMEEGNAPAKLVHGFQEDSERFLATIQIGVTVAGAAAAALSGAAAIESLKPRLLVLPFPFMETLAEPIAVGTVVLVISYFSLILGELVPKMLALKNPERLALFMARPLEWFSRVAAWGIKPLALSSRSVLRLLGKSAPDGKVFITEEEINLLMKEGQETGVFDKTEQELIRSVFEFTDTSVKEVMVPRPKMCAIEIDTPSPEFLRYIDENKFSRYPVYRKERNDLLGILYQKDLLSQVASGKTFRLTDLLHPVYYVPEAMKVSVLLKEMQRRRIHMAIVVNEHGSVEGLVTLEDLIEEIVGEIQDEYDMEEKPVERLKDGAFIIDASMPVKALVAEYALPIPISPEYETLSGFITYQIQGLPRGGEVFYHGDYKFTVVDLGDRRVAKVKVERIADRSRSIKEPVQASSK